MSRTGPEISSTAFARMVGVVGPLLFVVVFGVEGALRPDYDAARTTISTLALGDRGWVQATSFIGFGLVELAVAVRLRRTLGVGPGSLAVPLLVGVIGLGLVAAGVFATDPVLGYPPGAPAEPASLHGVVHNLAALAVFTALSAACFVLGWRDLRRGGRLRAVYSCVSGLIIVAFVLLFFGSVGSAARNLAEPSIAGLLERTFTVVGCVWLSLLAARTAGVAQPTDEKRSGRGTAPNI